LRAALGADTGYETARVAVAQLDAGLQRYDGPRAAAFLDALRARLAARADVEGTALATLLPVTGEENVTSYSVACIAPDSGRLPRAGFVQVSDDYYRV